LLRRSGDRNGDNGMFYVFIEALEEAIRKGVRFIRGGQPLKYVTTNDLDKNGKLKPNYLADRKRRRKERLESGEDDFY